MSRYIEYSTAESTIYCDCPNCVNQTFINSSFFDIIDYELQKEGWIKQYIDGEWLDFCCEDCLNDFMDELGSDYNDKN